ncbi:MAG: hypothetical protein ABSB10_00045 [Candidatus Bathyarchaeia archaeon]|jgi:hypothetical protein
MPVGNHTRKSKKYVEHEIVGQPFSVDSDELQLSDECNSEWVDAWKAAAKQTIEFELNVIAQTRQEKKLVGTKKFR